MAPVTCLEGLTGDQIICQAAKRGQRLKKTEREPEKIILTNNKLHKGGILHFAVMEQFHFSLFRELSYCRII